ncbi:CDP-glycerol glycerophosphotransferase family protein, partial [Actinomadura parmotrematis]
GARAARRVPPAATPRALVRLAGRPRAKGRAALDSPAVRTRLYRHLYTRLPIKRGTVVFESHLGKQYSDSPRAIYEALRASGIPIKAVWSYRDDPTGFPSDARLVERGSAAYYRALARAEFWIDNQGFPAAARKRPGTTYIQTWHGSAYKRMGFDQPDLKMAPPKARRRLRRMVKRFDAFVVRSEHDVRTLVPGFGLDDGAVELLRVGYPRNDALVTGGDPVALDALRRQLGLGDGRRAVLYAPTFRGDARGRVDTFALPFDVDRFVREFGGECVLLVRPHYLSAGAAPTSPCGTVRDASHVHDITSLLLVSDVLITDYSSVMFDFALLDRPMIFHAPDLDDYAGRARGAYFDLAQHAPGPVTADEDGLLDALRGLSRPDAYREARRRFVEEFGEYDTGTAAKSVVARFFDPGGRRGRA